ncbi:TRAP transporter large permease [Pacificispira spongiicola]|uniref:TRAP transporter large permease n=1 Tax=Pacificispira spongiicola TaxID=2729598 RepID=UPI0029CA58CC|nr:TRAP transporter large permease subunit [Pacificispira spongiicola]
MTDIAPFLDIALFITTCLALICGFPVAFTLAGTSLMFLGLHLLLGGDTLIGNLPARIFGSAMMNETLLAIPLFLFMGAMLEKSRIAEDLLTGLARLFGARPGGLGLSVILVGAMLAASTGIVGATVATMGMISLPAMLKRGYSPALASGTICAAGTLGQIIPPSIVLVILGDQISTAYQEAQSALQQQAWANGNTDFVPGAVSVGDLFAGALIPGLILVVLYLIFIGVAAHLKPTLAPPATGGLDDAESGADLLKALAPPALLIAAVLGSILTGLAPPTEAAAVGAVGATMLAAYRMPADNHRVPETPIAGLLAALLGGLTLGGIGGAFIGEGSSAFGLHVAIGAGIGAVVTLAAVRSGGLASLSTRLSRFERPAILAGIAAFPGMLLVPVLAPYLAVLLGLGVLAAFSRSWRAGLLQPVSRSVFETTAMIFSILIGAAVFGLVFRDLGGDDSIAKILNALPGGTVGAMAAVMLTVFVLGFFLDFVEICFVVVPIVAPILLLDPTVNPVWLGVMLALNLQTSFLTPPFGFALFYLRGVAPVQVKTSDIYRGALPFVLLQLAALAILATFPALSEWLPGLIFG